MSHLLDFMLLIGHMAVKMPSHILACGMRQVCSRSAASMLQVCGKYAVGVCGKYAAGLQQVYHRSMRQVCGKSAAGLQQFYKGYEYS